MHSYSMPKVSIIIPCYNVEKWVEECVISAIDQDYKNKEIIVIDDGSEDNTFEILQRFKEKIKVIRQENQGVINARRNGVNNSSGEYIIFFDSDDYIYEKTTVSKMVKKLRTNIDFIGFKAKPFYEDETRKPSLFVKLSSYFIRFIPGNNKLENFNWSMLGKLYKRETITKATWNSEIMCEDIKFFADNDFKKYKIYNKYCFAYRLREGSATHDVNQKRQESMKRVMISCNEKRKFLNLVRIENLKYNFGIPVKKKFSFFWIIHRIFR